MRNQITFLTLQQLLGNGELPVHAISLGHTIAYVLIGLLVYLDTAAGISAMMAVVVGGTVAVVGAAWCSNRTTRFARLAAEVVVIVIEGGKVTVAVVLLGHDFLARVPGAAV